MLQQSKGFLWTSVLVGLLASVTAHSGKAENFAYELLPKKQIVDVRFNLTSYHKCGDNLITIHKTTADDIIYFTSVPYLFVPSQEPFGLVRKNPDTFGYDFGYKIRLDAPITFQEVQKRVELGCSVLEDLLELESV